MRAARTTTSGTLGAGCWNASDARMKTKCSMIGSRGDCAERERAGVGRRCSAVTIGSCERVSCASAPRPLRAPRLREELRLEHHGHAELLRLLRLAAGLAADDQVVGFRADRRRDLAALVLHDLLRLG